jgi:hypothetical protein
MWHGCGVGLAGGCRGPHPRHQPPERLCERDRGNRPAIMLGENQILSAYPDPISRRAWNWRLR